MGSIAPRQSAVPLIALLLITLGLVSPLQAQPGPATPQSYAEVAQAAIAARDAHDAPRAIALYRQAVQLDPSVIENWWSLGLLLYDTDAYSEAAAALTEMINRMPNAAPAIALRGLCEFETANFPASLSDIQRGIRLGAANQPRNAQILRFHEALLLSHAGLFENALQDYTQLAQAGTPDPPVMLGLGLAGLRSTLLPREIPPDQQELYGTVGEAAFLILSGRQADGQAAFRQLFEKFPKTPNIHYFYGYLVFGADPDLAIDEFKRELAIAPDNDTARPMIAWALLMQQKPAEALTFAEQSSPTPSAAASNPLAQLVLGRALVETGKTASGIEHLQRAIQIDPDNLEAHLALAKAYSLTGRDEDAQQERLKCLQLAGIQTPSSASL